jgi:uncharacterized protein YndB with AHSA1/START domain
VIPASSATGGAAVDLASVLDEQQKQKERAAETERSRIMTELKTVEAEQFLPHPPAAVWRALTEPQLLAQWWAPTDIAPVVGHAFSITFPDWGAQRCTVTAVDEPRVLAYTFSEGVLDSVITWSLNPEGAGTRLFLEHAGFDIDTPIGKTGFNGMGAGWPGVISRINGVIAADLPA